MREWIELKIVFDEDNILLAPNPEQDCLIMYTEDAGGKKSDIYMSPSEAKKLAKELISYADRIESYQNREL